MISTKKNPRLAVGRREAVLAVASLALGCAASGAGAQAVAAVGQDTEVVITALKRETTLQSTPLSVSAVTGNALRKGDIQDISQLRDIPGLTFVDAGASNTRVVMRGVQTVGEPTVGVYYDETPVTGVVGASNDSGGSLPGLKLFDVNRVEVLRGPHGTLYGSGAMGGALRVLFNKPAPAYSAAIDATASETAHGGDGHVVQGMVNIPLIADKLTVRAVAFDETSAGYIDNTVLNIQDENATRSKGGRLLARLTPTADLTIDAGAFYQETHGDRPMWNLEAGAYNATNQVRLPQDELFSLYNVTAKWRHDGLTWVATASSINRKSNTGVGDPSYYFQSDINNPVVCAKLRGGGSPCSAGTQAAFNSYVQGYVYGVIFAAQKAHTTTSEVRVSSDDSGRLTWTTGAFYSDRKGRDDNNQFAVDPSTGLAYVPWIRETNRIIDDELQQTALFGEASYKLTSKLSLTLGTRFVHYERRVGGNVVVPLDLINAKASAYSLSSSSESKWVSKANLAYTYSPNILLYTQAAQGFRPGGVNQVLGLPDALQPYRSDSLWNYEAGIKTRSFGNRLTVNLDVYRIDWRDMQVQGQTTSGPFSFISNAGAARIDGSELEASLRLGTLVLSGSAGYSDARLSQDQLNANIVANGRRGDRIPYVPKLTGGLGADYSWSLAQGWRGDASVDASYVGESFSEFRPTNVYFRRLPAYTLVNLRAGVSSAATGWGIYVYADNLFDRVALTSATASAISVGHTLVTSATPRTVGVNVRKTF